jgi:hypothetical protein
MSGGNTGGTLDTGGGTAGNAAIAGGDTGRSRTANSCGGAGFFGQIQHDKTSFLKKCDTSPPRRRACLYSTATKTHGNKTQQKTAKKFSSTTGSCKNPGRIPDFQHSNTT